MTWWPSPTVTPPRAEHQEAALRLEVDRGILVNAEAQNARVLRHDGEETSDAPALGEVLINDDVAHESEARGQMQFALQPV